MQNDESFVDRKYRALIDAMTPAEKFQRVESLLHWTRELIARQVQAELGDVGVKRIKWEVAMRMYGSDPRVRKLLQELKPGVSC